MGISANVYAGVSGVKVASDEFPLGYELVCRKTYAHHFSTQMIAFSHAQAGKHHPPPWRAAKGGFAYDIDFEICVPEKLPESHPFDGKGTIWLIAVLLRIAYCPWITVPVISDHSFSEIAMSATDPSLVPFEVESRIFQAPTTEALLKNDILEWVRDNWLPVGRLMHENRVFQTAMQAFDSATIKGRRSSSMLALWGAIEEIFAPSRTELRFRVSAMLASYMSEPGPERYDSYKKIQDLYDERSKAAHTTQDVDLSPLVESYVLMRNALMKMIEKREIPTKTELEALLFGIENPE